MHTVFIYMDIQLLQVHVHYNVFMVRKLIYKVYYQSVVVYVCNFGNCTHIYIHISNQSCYPRSCQGICPNINSPYTFRVWGGGGGAPHSVKTFPSKLKSHLFGIYLFYLLTFCISQKCSIQDIYPRCLLKPFVTFLPWC